MEVALRGRYLWIGAVAVVTTVATYIVGLDQAGRVIARSVEDCRASRWCPLPQHALTTEDVVAEFAKLKFSDAYISANIGRINAALLGNHVTTREQLHAVIADRAAIGILTYLYTCELDRPPHGRLDAVGVANYAPILHSLGLVQGREIVSSAIRSSDEGQSVRRLESAT
jgi:hypothetical protein